MSNDEKAVEPDLLGKVDDPSVLSELKSFRPPNPHQMRTMRRIAQIENWLLKEGEWKSPDEIEAYAIWHFNISAGSAKKLVTEVIKAFEKIGKVQR